jgi:hypothetical protein
MPISSTAPTRISVVTPPVAQRGLQRCADERGHAELVEHRLAGGGRQLVGDRRLRGVGREGAAHGVRSVLPLPGHRRAQRPDPQVARGQRDVPAVEHRDSGAAGRVEDLSDPVDEAIGVVHRRQDADLRVVHQHRGRAGAAHLGDGVGNIETEGTLHDYSLSQGDGPPRVARVARGQRSVTCLPASASRARRSAS